MALWLQHLLVGVIVLACAAVVVWQSARALGGKRSKVGGCCAKGCGEQAAKPLETQGKRVVFMPVEMLSRRK